MKELTSLYRRILNDGVDTDDRPGVGRIRIFGVIEKFDISNGRFPLDTSRKQYPKNPIAEILMFIAGVRNIGYLHQHNVHIWDAWAVTEKTPGSMLQKMVDKDFCTPEQAAMAEMSFNMGALGEIGPMYGYLWRHWPTTSTSVKKPNIIRTVDDLPSDFRERVTEVYNGMSEEEKAGLPLDDFLVQMYYSAIDQLNELICNLKNDPYGSRHVVTAMNPEFTPVPGFSPDENVLLDNGALMPCHVLFQVFVKPPLEEGGKKRLSLLWFQRSCDAVIGIPTNIAGYALLAHLLAHVTDMETDELVFMGGDVHIYRNHVEKLKEQLDREERPAPSIKINDTTKDLFKIRFEDIEIVNYDPHPPIVYPIAV